jgi:hypothetical protein
MYPSPACYRSMMTPITVFASLLIDHNALQMFDILGFCILDLVKRIRKGSPERDFDLISGENNTFPRSHNGNSQDQHLNIKDHEHNRHKRNTFQETNAWSR